MTVLIGRGYPTQALLDRSGMAAGEIAGCTVVHKFGESTNVTNTGVVVTSTLNWAGFLTAASTVRVRAGGSSNDTAAGSGMRTIRIEGLDANGDEIFEDITLAGASASSSTAKSFLRVQRAIGLTSGTYTATGLNGSNAANIVVETTGGTALITIKAGLGQSQHAVYTVPRGKVAHLMHVDASTDISGGAATCNVYVYQRQNITTITGSVAPARIVETYSGVQEVNDSRFEGSVVFPALTDVWIVAQNNVASTATVSASFGLEVRTL